MNAKIFINLPVRDLAVSKSFYQATGFINIPEFSDETAACMMFSGEIYVMLLTYQKFSEFTHKKISDAHLNAGVILSLSVETLEMMHLILNKALKAGARETLAPIDLGFMQQGSFEDPDGHLWEIIFMDTTKLQ